MASINRPTLTAAVRSVLDQEFTADDFEVIVVNDTGQALPDMEWQHSNRVSVVTTQKRERSVARNTGAAIARGKYLHFLDSDDLMLPGALEAFWRLDQTTDSTWLYGSYRTVKDNGDLLKIFHPDVSGDFFALAVAGELIPFQASLLRTTQFFIAGAFDPNFTIVEDFDLGRRIAFLGNVAKTSAIVAQIRTGEEGSTGNWSKFPERWYWSREKILNQAGTFERLWGSVGSNSYLRGRVSRAYLASLVWNLSRKNLLIAANRFISMLILAGFHTFSKPFWQGYIQSSPGSGNDITRHKMANE